MTDLQDGWPTCTECVPPHPVRPGFRCSGPRPPDGEGWETLPEPPPPPWRRRTPDWIIERARRRGTPAQRMAAHMQGLQDAQEFYATNPREEYDFDDSEIPF